MERSGVSHRRRAHDPEVGESPDLRVRKKATVVSRGGVLRRVVGRLNRMRKEMTLKHLVMLAVTMMVLWYMNENNIILGYRGLLMHTYLPIERNIKQSKMYLFFWTYFLPGSRASYEKARLYYESQLPHFEKAAKEFEMHQYWTRTAIDRKDVGWYEMISLRAKAMAEMFDESGADGFKIEKDKCEMYRFFTRNGFLTSQIHGYWDDKDRFLDEVYGGTAIPNGAKWPIFIKSCHLTQGSSKSTYMLKSEDYLKKYRSWFVSFVEDKWSFRADDFERPWADDMNKLTDSLTPGIMLQGPYPTSWDDWAGKYKVVEMKVECFWGRAYLANVNFGRDTIILRDGSIEYYDYFGSKTNSHTESIYNTWIREEGHLERVWELAETAAKIMGIDQVRIDIFIKKGDPDAIRINENSISSGMGYRSHFHFMPRIWAMGHANKWYKTFQTKLPVYRMSLPEGNCPNQGLLKGKAPPYVGSADPVQ